MASLTPVPPVAPKPSKADQIASVVKREVAVVLGSVLAAVNALQLLAVPLPAWTHVAIVVVTTVAASLGIRARVTPSVV